MNDEQQQIEDNAEEIMLLKDIASLAEYSQGDKYELGIKVFDDALDGGFEDGDLIIISGASGYGKCHGKGTKIMMHDGSVKNVEDVIVGDKLMGDDSTPRNVISLARGKENMYSINDIKGNRLYTCNGSHILSLRKSGTNEILNISINEYLKKNNYFKSIHKGYMVGLNFSEQELPIDPYFLGLWLGDGTSEGPAVTTADKEIVEFINSYAKYLGLGVTIQDQGKNKSKVYSIVREKKFKAKPKLICNGKIYLTNADQMNGYGDIESLKTKMVKLNLINNKHIPDIYKFNSRENRLKLLAGLIDSDGTNAGNCYEITQKKKELIDDIIWLAKSLGMRTSLSEVTKTIKSINFSGKYWRAGIYGELSEVPVLLKKKKCHKRLQHKNPLNYGFIVEDIGYGDYYGFEIDGNHLYVLGDFSVTHNTTFSQQLAINFAEKGLPVLFLSYEVMVHHLWKKFKTMNINDELPLFSIKRHTTGNVGWIEQKIKEAKEANMIKFVVIDHLGFLIPKQRTENIGSNQAAFVSQIVRELKTLAKNERVVIILPVHVRKTDDPGMNDLKDSSAISQESDAVFILNREKNPLEGVGDYYTDHTLIKMVKNRKTGMNAQGWFQMINGRFVHDNQYVPMPKPQRSIMAF